MFNRKIICNSDNNRPDLNSKSEIWMQWQCPSHKRPDFKKSFWMFILFVTQSLCGPISRHSSLRALGFEQNVYIWLAPLFIFSAETVFHDWKQILKKTIVTVDFAQCGRCYFCSYLELLLLFRIFGWRVIGPFPRNCVRMALDSPDSIIYEL